MTDSAPLLNYRRFKNDVFREPINKKTVKEIPVLLYQHIGDYPEEMMEDGLLLRSFERQMGFLSENGYNVVSLNRALDHLAGRIKLPPKSIAITIDGGYKDAFSNVLPVLKRHNFHATFFILPEYIGKERTIKGNPIKCLNWGEVDEIFSSGMEIGLLAYGGKGIRNHYNEQAIKEDVFASMKLLNSNLTSEIKYCAFKVGVADTALWNFLQGLGFHAVFTQCPTYQRRTLAGIGRIQVDDDDHNIFLTKISNIYLFFKDKRSWKYIRKYRIDRLAHRISETWNRIKGEAYP